MTCPCSWPLPAITTTSPARADAIARSIAAPRSSSIVQLAAPPRSPSTIAAGNEFAAAHKGTQLWIWGRDNSGQLGNGVSTTSQGTPTLVALPGIYTFGLGSEHVLAYLPQSAQNWYVWGKNSWGQLGNGGLSNRTSLSPITGPTFLHVSQIYASASATLVAGASGFSPAKPGLELSSTGRNDYRQLLHKLPSPVRILSGMAGVLIEGWDQVAGVSHGYLQNLAAGNGYTLVIAGTTVKAIGLNQAGQLGDGTLTSRSTPTNVCLP